MNPFKASWWCREYWEKCSEDLNELDDSPGQILEGEAVEQDYPDDEAPEQNLENKQAWKR